MSRSKRAMLKGKSLVKRLTGISTPIGGLNWEPPPDEQDIARKLIVFLEDRRALYMPYDMEIGMYVVDSVQEIRDRLTQDLETISKSSVLGESVVAMRASCRKFLTQTQEPPKRIHHYGIEGLFWEALGELRAIFGLHIARIAYSYKVDVEKTLEPILPAEYDKDGCGSYRTT